MKEERKEWKLNELVLEKISIIDKNITSNLSNKILKIIMSMWLSYLITLSTINVLWSRVFLVLDWGTLFLLYTIIVWGGIVIYFFLDNIIDLIILLLKKIK